MGSRCAAGLGRQYIRRKSGELGYIACRNRHWKSPGRYHKKLPNSPALGNAIRVTRGLEARGISRGSDFAGRVSRLQVPLDAFSITSLIDAFARQGQLDDAFAALELGKWLGVPPSTAATNALIHACAVAKQHRRALEVSACGCELSAGGNINAVVRNGYDWNCLHHDLEVLNNPVPPPSSPSRINRCTRRRLRRACSRTRSPSTRSSTRVRRYGLQSCYASGVG
jgi:pentatricopeptide repeat protein